MRLAHTILMAATTTASFATVAAAQTCRDGADYAGRYTGKDGYVVHVVNERYGLSIRPSHWSSKQLLIPTPKPDSLVVADNPARNAVFARDASGCIASVVVAGLDGGTHALTRGGGVQPIEHLRAGNGEAAVRGYKALGTPLADLLVLAQRLITQAATNGAGVAAFLDALSKEHPRNADILALLGHAHVDARDRARARVAFEAALRIDATNASATAGMYMLGQRPELARTGWQLPFSLDSVFAPPTAQEIDAVRSDWASRKLQPANVKELATGTMLLGKTSANVRIVSHDVHGTAHIGAIVVPRNAAPGCCAVILQLRGVSWSYSPLRLDRGIEAADALADLNDQAIYVIPSFRAETIEFDGKSYKSDGVVGDSWDGATDDAIALLNVALATTPQADAQRICTFGHSRGGSVSLLMGMRDPRVDCVVNMAGPTDWFELMGVGGWTQKELAAEGLRIMAKPNQTAGQFMERFLIPAVEGKWDLRMVRHRMLASSPLYFASSLPHAQLHYGMVDPSVPERNGRMFVRELEKLDGSIPRYEAYFYPNAGHDTDRIAAPRLAGEFMAEALKLKR